MLYSTIIFWLKNGGKLNILKDMFHYQRIHKNSYYIREGEKAKNSVEFFTKQIMDLPGSNYF